MTQMNFTLWFDDPRATDIAKVGGKNASLADMVQSLVPTGVRVPMGFAVTADAYWHMLRVHELTGPITAELALLDAGKQTLQKTGSTIRNMLRHVEVPRDLREAIVMAYRELCRREGVENVPVAVRSSATAEDLPTASFAGQQESYLNITGENDVIAAYCDCVSSLFTDRAIAYRDENGFAHMKVALSVGVQRLVRSDLASSGVMFTLDTETGFPDVVFITGAFGLGENVVKGTVNPDEMVLYKPFLKNKALRPILRARTGEKEQTMVLAVGGNGTTKNVETPFEKRRRFCITDDEALQLGRWAVQIEENTSAKAGAHQPMDIEWAKDGVTGELFIVQARPETVQSRRGSGIVRYALDEKGTALVHGRAVGAAIATGKASVIASATHLDTFQAGDILVAESTDPDWVPAMRKAAGIITEHGGRTCHAAIVARELGVPAIVGAAGAMAALKNGAPITLSCAGGDEGIVYDGTLKFTREDVPLDGIGETKTKIMINLADPAGAFQWWRLPTDGVGLARMEFIINEDIQVHPMALVRFDEVDDAIERKKIEELTKGYATKSDFFVDKLARGIAMIAASQYPRPVIVRMSDFKTNEYAGLLGGKRFEPAEENPMIGFRGASRYYSERYKPGFLLECRAIKRVREEIGLTNVIVMIPFCRTLDEADRVLATMREGGLTRGENGLLVYVMCEIPANVILAEEFAERFDGFSIGSNDLTQLTLGVDRDSEILAPLFDERNLAVKRTIADVIARAHKVGSHVGICGQGPSDHADFAEFLVEQGIDSLSLNPDSFIGVKQRVAALEKRLKRS
jgi:pyruvate,water dikinase